MMHLTRLAYLEDGCFGALLWDGVPFAVTVERTYPGQRGVASVKIKPGSYKCVRSHYHKGNYDCWQIVGGEITLERRILIHKANVEDDLDGCVGVGESFGRLHGKPAVLQSGAAFAELMSLSSNVDEFELAVI